MISIAAALTLGYPGRETLFSTSPTQTVSSSGPVSPVRLER